MAEKAQFKTECKGLVSIEHVLECPLCCKSLSRIIKEKGYSDPQGFIQTARKLLDILHSACDTRYEWEIRECLLQLSGVVVTDGLSIREKTVPKSLPKLPEDVYGYLRHAFHHAEDMCWLMARLLYRRYRVSLDKGHYKIVPQPWYSGGKADIGLVQGEKYEDWVTLIAIEVGEVRANKVVEAFMNPNLRELWVYPYPTEGDWIYEYPREGNHYYIFRRGPRWVKVSRRLREEEMRQLKSVVSLLEDEALLEQDED
jgi:hypothetical protein